MRLFIVFDAIVEGLSVVVVRLRLPGLRFVFGGIVKISSVNDPSLVEVDGWVGLFAVEDGVGFETREKVI